MEAFEEGLIGTLQPDRNPRGIDGMLLTKYDTVDDKDRVNITFGFS